MSDVVDPALDEEGDEDADLREALGLEAPRAPAKPKNRFECAGSRRVDELTGKKLCTYRAPNRWGPGYTASGYCPGCNRPFACVPIKRDKVTASQVTLGKKTMDAHRGMVYYSTGFPEVDRVFGGGLVLGKVYLFAADRGSGKSTLLIKIADNVTRARTKRDGSPAFKSLFASGEMDGHTNVDYAKRIGVENDDLALYCNPQGVDVEELFERVLDFGARFVFVDSIQLCTVSDVKGDIGKPAMIDACINMFSSFAQAKKRCVFLIGHLTKAQDFAGTEQTQHLVDALLRMERRWVPPAHEGGKPVDTMLREISMDGKSRQGRSDVTALMELTEKGMSAPSVRALRMLNGTGMIRV